VRDLASGRNRRITNKGSWAESNEWAETSVVSPDGRQIAYTWYNKDSFYELRLIPAGGGQPRVLFRREDVFWIQTAGWTGDGKQVLALLSDRNSAKEIVAISAADGAVRSLKRLDWRWPQKISLSPDGRYVLYDALRQKDSAERDVWMLSTGAASEEVLIQHPADDYAPLWSPDGKKVLFASDRTGATSLWAVAVAQGKAQGAPELVKANVGRISPLGFTREGSYYYGLGVGMEDIYVAELDPATGKVLGSPERITERFLGANSAPAWSPDGRQLAYLSHRGPATKRPGSLTVVIRSVPTGEERDLPTKLNLSPPVQWFPDGRSLLVSARENQGGWSFYRMDAQSGDTSLIGPAATPGGGFPHPALSPDGKAVFFSYRDVKARRSSIWAREIQGGREQELYRTPGIEGVASLALSRDGRQLVFALPDHGLYCMPAGGGGAREILRRSNTHGPGRLAWTPDGRYVLAARDTGSPGRFDLWRVPVAGGEPQKIDLPGENVAFPSAHPDGRRIAHTAGRAGQSEIWVLENFLPALK